MQKYNFFIIEKIQKYFKCPALVNICVGWRSILFQGRFGVGFYIDQLTLWNALADSLGWKLKVSFPVPYVPSEGGGFLNNNLTAYRQVVEPQQQRHERSLFAFKCMCKVNPLVPRVQKIKIRNFTLNRLLVVEFVKKMVYLVAPYSERQGLMG